MADTIQAKRAARKAANTNQDHRHDDLNADPNHDDQNINLNDHDIDNYDDGWHMTLTNHRQHEDRDRNLRYTTPAPPGPLDDHQNLPPRYQRASARQTILSTPTRRRNHSPAVSQRSCHPRPPPAHYTPSQPSRHTSSHPRHSSHHHLNTS